MPDSREILIFDCQNQGGLTCPRRTRSSARIHIIDDEQHLSSGDESDDADLTDGGSTSSGWTDIEGK